MIEQRLKTNDDTLSSYIDGLRHIPAFERYRLIQGMMCLIREYQDDLLDRFVLDFPLEPEPNRSQWYDKDPYLWLVINGVQYANRTLQRQVAAYLEAELDEKTLSFLRLPGAAAY